MGEKSDFEAALPHQRWTVALATDLRLRRLQADVPQYSGFLVLCFQCKELLFELLSYHTLL